MSVLPYFLPTFFIWPMGALEGWEVDFNNLFLQEKQISWLKFRSEFQFFMSYRLNFAMTNFSSYWMLTVI